MLDTNLIYMVFFLLYKMLAPAKYIEILIRKNFIFYLKMNEQQK